MSGLDKIIETIDGSFEQSCGDVIADAKKQADDIIKKAESQAAQEKNELLNLSRQGFERDYARSVASFEADGKRKLLYAKVGAADKVISKAMETIKELPDGQYFDLCLRLFEKYFDGGDCAMLFSPDDIKRMPKDFSEKISQKAGKSRVDIQQDDGIKGGGFVLDFGEISENCTFDALLENNADRIKDRVFAALFEKAV